MEPVSDFHFFEGSKFNYGRLFWSVDPYGPFRSQSFMMRGAGSQLVWVVPEDRLIIVHLVRTDPLLLRQWLNLIPDDNEAWTFGAEVGSAVLDPQMKRPDRQLY
jgi:CubicO group peptidase (beta-lactamase class C family)